MHEVLQIIKEKIFKLSIEYPGQLFLSETVFTELLYLIEKIK